VQATAKEEGCEKRKELDTLTAIERLCFSSLLFMILVYSPLVKSNMEQNYRHANTSVTLINYHFVWTVRRRKPVLVGEVAQRLEKLSREKVIELDCQIISLEVRPDHVRLFLDCPPTVAPSDIMYRLKGATACKLRDEFPHLKKLPSMWTRNFFCSTADSVSSETVKQYIENQKTR
jgi:putative transposase